jgi:hypothetical protein
MLALRAFNFVVRLWSDKRHLVVKCPSNVNLRSYLPVDFDNQSVTNLVAFVCFFIDGYKPIKSFTHASKSCLCTFNEAI